MALWSLCQPSLGSVEDSLCGADSTPFLHTQCSWLYPKPENNSLGPSKVREAPSLLCVSMWERERETKRDREREISIRNWLKIPWSAVDKLDTQESWWCRFSVKVCRLKTQEEPMFQLSLKAGDDPAWRQLGRRNSLLSGEVQSCSIQIFNWLDEVHSY